MSERNFDIEVKTGITAKQAPDFKDVTLKAVAGITEHDLVERHTIGKIKNEEDEDEEDKREQQPTETDV